jgi:hypothetical protein
MTTRRWTSAARGKVLRERVRARVPPQQSKGRRSQRGIRPQRSCSPQRSAIPAARRTQNEFEFCASAHQPRSKLVEAEDGPDPRAHALEKVPPLSAPGAHQGGPSSRSGGGPAQRHSHGHQPTRLLASGAHAGCTSREECRVAAAAGVDQYPSPLDEGARVRLSCSRAPRS